MSFTDFIHTYITTPLGLVNTKTPQDNFDTTQIVKSYSTTYKGDMQGIDYPIEIYNQIGAGGMYSTAIEVCKFANIFFDNTLLSESSVNATFMPEYLDGIWHQSSNSSIAFGLGWDNVNVDPYFDAGIQVIAKNGDTLQSHSTLMIVPEANLSVVVLSANGSSIYTNMMASQLVLDALLEYKYLDKVPNIISFNAPKYIAPMPSNYVEYSGLYGNFYTDYTIEVMSEGILTISPNQYTATPQMLYYTGEGYFVDINGKMRAMFYEELNGNVYLQTEGIIDIGFVPMPISQYELQKLEPISISSNLENIWKERIGNSYLLLNEKFTSQVFTTQVQFILPDMNGTQGYLGHYQIIDESTLINPVAIPQHYGRDIADVKIVSDNGIEYLISNNNIFIEETKVSPLFVNDISTYTIDNSGYAQWFSNPFDNNSINVDINGNGMFAIYNFYGECIYNSYLEGNKVIELLPQTKIVFVGDVGTTFTVNLI